MRSGVRLGIDVGRARIGVARCDLHGMLATPVETVARTEGGGRSGRGGRVAAPTADVARILELASELDAVELVVGLPLGLSGHRTPSTDDAEAFALRLVAAGGPPVRLVDERLSTVSAQGQRRAAGRKSKQSRGVIDQAAAVVILQHALDVERARGAAPGTVVARGVGAAAGTAAGSSIEPDTTDDHIDDRIDPAEESEPR